jgi:hypothetical protein
LSFDPANSARFSSSVPSSDRLAAYSGSEYDLLIAQTRQRGDLVPKSPGIGLMPVKDAYFWNALC